MASVNIEQIAKAVAARLTNVDRQVTAFWYDELNAPTKGPSISLRPGAPLYRPFGTMGPSGRADVAFVARVRANSASRESNFSRLYGFASHGTSNADSIHDAVMSDRSLGGVVSDCVLGDVEFDEDEGGPYLDVEVFVIAMKQGAEV